jgi:hypothetical protein
MPSFKTGSGRSIGASEAAKAKAFADLFGGPDDDLPGIDPAMVAAARGGGGGGGGLEQRDLLGLVTHLREGRVVSD